MALKDFQTGQTLIETLVAGFVLVMGISAAVGLAIYGLTATDNISKQIIATGLAREGVEAVKNMRDTNWLQDTLDTSCYDYYTLQSGQNCYVNWLRQAYNIDPEAESRSYVLRSYMPGDTYWSLIPASGDEKTGVYGLDSFDPGKGYSYYSLENDTPKPVAESTSGFARKITIYKDTESPFDPSSYERIKVKVDVWWTDQRCPISETVPESTSCRVTLETYLTNWRNY